MTLTWVQLAALLLISNVTLNFGAPQGNLIISGNYDFSSTPLEDPNSSSYNIWYLTTMKEGQCVKTLTIKGNGVDDNTLSFPCSWGHSTYTSKNDILITGKDVETNSIYSKQHGQLQIIEEGKCSIRNYKISSGKTTISTTPVEGTECDAMKKEHNERLKKWEQWQAETFPPGFPFHDKNKPGSTNLKPNLNPPTGGNSPTQSNNLGPTDSTPKPIPSNDGNVVFSPPSSNPTNENDNLSSFDWDKWEKETFPPGFPFHNTNQPGSTSWQEKTFPPGVPFHNTNQPGSTSWQEETFPPGFPFHNTNKPGSTNPKPNLNPSTDGILNVQTPSNN